MLAQWWVWMAAGFALGILEMLVPTWLFAGFALGALATGAMLGAGLPGAAWMAASPANAVMVFAVLSLAAWLAMRFAFGKPGGSVKRIDRDINEG
jgi:membrane protein implicated in regulation of membrane protease activity